jgi:exodeoxyribonuclease-5
VEIFNEEQFPDWDSVITFWRNKIKATALSLKEGNAKVTIADDDHLNYCEVKPILRVAERELQFEHEQSAYLTTVGDVSR